MGKVVTLIIFPRIDKNSRKNGAIWPFEAYLKWGTIELQGDHTELVKGFFRTVKLKERFYI
jgi:translation initiation factor 1 (eIF-1/SUI1)